MNEDESDAILNSLEVVNRLSAKIAPGRFPAYYEAHILKALEIIGSCNGIGRHKLSKELGIGEGTTRTIIGRLKEEGIVETSRRGMTLTKVGIDILSEFGRLIESTNLSEMSLTVGLHNYAVLVKGAANLIKWGIEQRDAALLAGAKGATTLLYDGERLYMPGLNSDIDDPSIDYLLEHLKPETGDVIIIGTADLLLNAEIGAKSAALKLLKERVRRITA